MSLQSEMLVEQKVSNAQKSTGTAYLLWFFLGGFGAHRFYLGKTGTAITQLIITLIGCFTLFPLIITGIWWIVDAFLIPGIIQGHTEQTRRDARLEVAALQVAGASASQPQGWPAHLATVLRAGEETDAERRDKESPLLRFFRRR